MAARGPAPAPRGVAPGARPSPVPIVAGNPTGPSSVPGAFAGAPGMMQAGYPMQGSPNMVPMQPYMYAPGPAYPMAYAGGYPAPGYGMAPQGYVPGGSPPPMALAAAPPAPVPAPAPAPAPAAPAPAPGMSEDLRAAVMRRMAEKNVQVKTDAPAASAPAPAPAPAAATPAAAPLAVAVAAAAAAAAPPAPSAIDALAAAREHVQRKDSPAAVASTSASATALADSIAARRAATSTPAPAPSPVASTPVAAAIPPAAAPAAAKAPVPAVAPVAAKAPAPAPAVQAPAPAAPAPAPAPAAPAPAPAPAAPAPAAAAPRPPAPAPAPAATTTSTPAVATSSTGATFAPLLSDAFGPADALHERPAASTHRTFLDGKRVEKKRYTVAEMKQMFDSMETLLLRVMSGAGAVLPGFKAHRLLTPSAMDDDDGSNWQSSSRGGQSSRHTDSRDRGSDRNRGSNGGGQRAGGGGGGGGFGSFRRHDDFDDDMGPDPYKLLTKSKDAWSKNKAATDPLEKTVGTVRALLNKISKETFDKLSDDILAQPVDSQDLLERIIDVVFDKALEDVFFQDLYAELCKKLGDKAVTWSDRYLRVREFNADDGPAGAGWYIDMSGREQWQGPHESREKATDEGKRLSNFKRLLLNRCQQEFQKENQYKPLEAEQQEDEAKRAAGGLTRADEDALKRRADIRTDKRGKIKRRMLANISFIGQLYMIEGMLTQPIMHYCVARLLNNGDVSNPDEQNVESLCKLIFTIGRKFAAEDSATPSPKMPVYFELLTQVSNNMRISSRVRFMCKDVIDFRNGGWVLRGAMASIEKRTETKTREEVRKIIAEEEAAKAAPAAHNDGKRGGGGSSRPASSRPAAAPAAPRPAQTGPTTRGPATFTPASRGGNAARPAVAGGRGSPAAAPAAPTAGEDGQWTTVPARGAAAANAISAAAAGSSSPAAASAPVPAPAEAVAASAALVEVILTGPALRKRTHAILDEYATLKSSEELERSVTEIRGSEAWSGVMLTDALTFGYTAKDDFRNGAAAALSVLAEKGMLVKADILPALAAFAGIFTEAIVDAPKIGEYTAQILAPIVSTGFLTLADISVFFASVASTGVAGHAAAMLLQHVLASADAAVADSNKERVVAAAGSNQLSLITLTVPSAGSLRLKKVKEVVGANPVLSAAFPEVDVLFNLRSAIQDAVANGDADADALVAAVHAAPAAARSRRDFARWIAAECVFVAARDAEGDETVFRASVRNARLALRAALGYAEAPEAAVAAGVSLLSGIQVFAASSDDLDPKVLGWAFEEMLRTGDAATDIPIVKAASLSQWLDASAPSVEPAGREAAAKAAADVAAKLGLAAA